MKNFNCAVCNTIVLPDEFGMCSACNWEYDPVQEADPTYCGGANKRSLKESKSEWLRLKPTTQDVIVIHIAQPA
jgi:rubredoxin